MVVPPGHPDGPHGALHPGSARDIAAVRVCPRYSVEPVTTEPGRFDLEADWNRLSRTADVPNAFTTLDWYRAWNKRIAGEDLAGRRGPCVLAIRNDGAVLGIAPLVHRTVSRFGLTVRKLEFLESPADYNDFVLGDDPVRQIEAVIAYFGDTQHEWDLIDLRNLHGSGHAITQFKRALSSTDFSYRILPEARCPYLAINSEASGMMSRLSRSSRRTLRNQQYRLERMRAEGLHVRIIEAPQDGAGLGTLSRGSQRQHAVE